MIKNESTDTVIASSAKKIVGLAQSTGLMFKKTLDDQGWVFVFSKKGRWPLTNLFVFQTITAVWLDDTCTVLQVKRIRPFVPHVSGFPNTSFVIELPKSSFDVISVGDTISWAFSG